MGLNGNPAVSFIQDFEHTTLNAYIFALILHLTCKTKKIILPLLLTSQITESLEKTFFFLICDYSLHFFLDLVVVLLGAMRCRGMERREYHFSFQRKKDMSL